MKSYYPVILLLTCAVVLVVGIVHLFDLRFDVGDVYPPYSSLRSDPLGTMALYEALGRLSGLEVERDFSTTNVLPPGSATTYLHVASTIDEWLLIPVSTLAEIEKFAAVGGRFVVTMT